MSNSAEQLAALATKRQIEASDPDVSVWVSASAGSGKTKVLIDRFVRLLLAGNGPQHILCLTYTRAAAAEMAERVMRLLGDWTICGEEELVQALGALTGDTDEAAIDRLIPRARRLFAAALDCPGGLRIKTFHAFAQEVLARFPIEAGIAPHFKLLEEGDAAAMRDASLEQVLANMPQDEMLHQAWRTLVGAFDSEAITDLLRHALHERGKLDAAMRRYGNIDGLQQALRGQLRLPPEQTADDVLREACGGETAPLALLKRVIGLYRENGGKTALDMAARLEEWFGLPPQERAANFEVYCSFFFTDKGEIRKKLLPGKLAENHGDIQEALVIEAERIHVARQRLQSLRRIELTGAILTLGGALLAEYRRRKDRAAALDFDDVIDKTAALLHAPGKAEWVLWKLDGGIDHIMIDEAQDTSPAQWAIIKALTEEFFAGKGAKDKKRTLFVVGDEKQSIYSFQHADPAMFQAMRYYFSQRAALREIALNVSFRSAPAILRAVDRVFSGQAAAGVSAEAVQHFAERQEASGHVELWPVLAAAKSGDDDEAWTPRTAYEFAEDSHVELAGRIAARIGEWKAQGVPPGDILILVRRRNELVWALVRALKERAIPVSGLDRMKLLEQIGVRDLLAVMQFALAPEDDLNLACVLRGPLTGMDEATLESLCHGREGSLWQALRAAAPENPKIQSYAAWLAECLGLADWITPYAFLARILQMPCPAALSGHMALAARLGADVLDPIDELLNRAQDFSHEHAPSLQNFLQRMRRDESEIKRELGRGAGEVRIMTVHAAKGLEAPIVILPDSCAPPRTLDAAKLQWDAETKLPYYIGGAQAERDDHAEELLARAHGAAMAEYRRLLYVALTRARDRLYIFGHRGKKASPGGNWHELIRGALAPDAAETPDAPLVVMDDPNAAAEEDRQKIAAKIEAPPLPEWLRRAAPAESLPRHLSPSRLGADDSAAASPARGAQGGAFARGRILHRLLQYLPAMPEAARESAAERFLDRQCGIIDPADRAAHLAEVMRIIGDPAYAPLFAEGSYAEVPIAGMIDDATVSGQIDRLALAGDEIWIVDYKTNRPPPADESGIPMPYRRQMAAYRTLVQQIYPGKKTRCFLLWTYQARIMEVPEDAMAQLDLEAA
ncbi:MAG: double-strand break repair helicase AddA [Alphaproteobacteria bacterium]